ncbi:M1 family aminopeptidase [Flammeovirgaceae bacterium SG7u.111]|nr:M1 family aminopeptidase [Flammeovirgaceae bacterium SG7u.132]WPO37831.1 M1 family aminopeptidase [Flammeovirgaceae bacterium SG7u.111]
MFSQLVRFEASYQLRQKALPIFALIFFLYGALAGSQGAAPAKVNFNSNYQINFYTGLFSLGVVFIVIFFSISGILRDKRYRMDSLIYSTAVKKYQFFWSRFLGVYVFSLLAFTPMMLGLLAGFLLGNLDPERVSSFQVLSYLKPWLFTIVPNVFICTTLIFAVSALTKSNLATYMSSIFIYMLYMISSIFLNSPLMAQSVPASPEAMQLAALADPFGISAFYEQTQFWTPFQKNTQMLSFSGLYRWNRILWMGVSLVILLVTYRLFSFRKVSQKVKKTIKLKEETTQVAAYEPVQPSQKAQSQLAALFSLLKVELNGIFKSLPFVGIMVVWLFIVFMEINARVNGGGAYGDSWYPFTNLLIELLVDPLTILTTLPILFYSGEIVWRECSLNFSGIIDATPVANWAFFLSKLFALLIIPVLFITSGILIAMLFQVACGYFNFEIGQYLSIFYHYGIQLFFFCIIAMFVQSTVRNKYLGMGIAGMLILVCFFTPYIGIEHPMLRLGYFPRPTYTNMTGFSGGTPIFDHLVIYWMGLGGILSLFSFKLWQRGINQSLSSHLVTLFSNWKKWESGVLVIFVMLFVGAGATIFYSSNVVNEYSTAAEDLAYREAYERKFKQYENLDKLFATTMKTEVDLFPDEQSYHIKAAYTLMNKGEKPISTVFITEKIPLSSIKLEGAKLLEYNSEFGTYLYEFEQPIQPQQEVWFSYELTKTLTGYETSRTIVPNGSYLTDREFAPILSYRESVEIADNREREKRGLPRKEKETLADKHFETGNSPGRISYETIISTQADEIAIGSGSLVRQWTENGRNYFHFKPTHKIIPTMGYFSSAYAVQKEEHNGVSIEQYFHPEHAFNTAIIATSAKASLDYCIENFGPYRNDHIRIAEVPSHWPMGGFAHPGVISMVEDNLYLIDTRNEEKFNLVAKRTIHEVSHQWWGHLLTPKLTDGGSVLVEGFAKYTEAVVMEKMYGKRALWQLSLTANQRYFQGRAFASEKEPPLYLVYGQGYLSYGKSYTVMLALRELLGEEQLNKVLRTLADRYRDQTEFGVDSSELLDELYKVASPAQHVLIDDWFKRVITYDLSAEKPSVKELGDGRYEVTVKLNAKRFETNEEGEEVQIAINEPISIGLFVKHPSQVSEPSDIIYLQPHQITKEYSEIKIIVDDSPKFVAIDPFGTRSDPDLNNNVKSL